MVEHVWESVKLKGSANILETGCAWDKDNWEGQGQSTLIWDWLIDAAKTDGRSISAMSVDITPTSIESARKQTKNIELVLSDSVKHLNSLHSVYLEHTFLVYLDSFDWSIEKNLESSFHHMAELATIWSGLPQGCMIVVDDRHGDHVGKHWMVETFLSHYLKMTPVFKNHQIGYIK
jgi:hypothetical protein